MRGDCTVAVHIGRLGLLVSAVISVPVHPVQAADAPLIAAARAGDVDGVRRLISERADVNPQSADGSTPLLWAAYHGELSMVEALLAAGAKPDIANRYGVTPLLQASRAGDAAVIARVARARCERHAAASRWRDAADGCRARGAHGSRRAVAGGRRRRQRRGHFPARDRADARGGRGPRGRRRPAAGSGRQPESASARHGAQGA